VTLGPVAALLEGSEPTPIPERVGATEIEQIRPATQVFESWCLAYGGGLGREAVLAQLRWSAGLLEATCLARLRPELFRAVGDLAWVYQALALAKMRRSRETLAAVGTADDHFAHSTPANDPPFMTFWNAGMQTETIGQALADLAVLGRDPAEATNRLTTAVTGNVPGHARCRAFSLTKLASLTMATG
jgi:hypothetical protein